MPPLARNLTDTNGLAVLAAWINSLPGTPALAPPSILPSGGTFAGQVTITLEAPTNASVFYTLNGSMPTTNSMRYAGPFSLTKSAQVSALAVEPGFVNSVQSTVSFSITPGITLSSASYLANGTFELAVSGTTGKNYILEGSTNLLNWIVLSTNQAATASLLLSDPAAGSYPARFYRVQVQP
jgi:hypothetical protein